MAAKLATAAMSQGCAHCHSKHARPDGPPKVRTSTISMLGHSWLNAALKKRLRWPYETEHRAPPCPEPCVPRRIHLVWMGCQLPTRLWQTVLTIATENPDYEVNLWSEYGVPGKASAVIVRNISSYRWHNSVMLNRFSALNNAGVVSDLLRLEVVYRFGGIYLDIDVEVTTSLALYPRFLSSAFLYAAIPGDGDVGNNIFGFGRHSSFLHFVIRLANENYLRFFKLSRGTTVQAGGPLLATAFLLYNSSCIQLNHGPIKNYTPADDGLRPGGLGEVRLPVTRPSSPQTDRSCTCHP